MKKVYIIEGHTGEYSDRYSWTVMAYLDADKASAKQALLTEKLQEFGLGGGFVGDWDMRNNNAEKMREFDEKFSCDYTGTHYSIETVDLEE